ncbi:MAG: hypothetical protein AAF743_02790 [Planctomycetota bacterium]
MSYPTSTQPIDLGYDGGRRGDVIADERCIQALSGTRPWVMTWAVLMFLGAALFGLGGIFMMVAMGLASAGGGGGTLGPEPSVMIGIGVGYLIGAAVYVVLGVMLVRYFAAIGRTARHRQTDDLLAAINAQKSFWRLTVIIMIVFVVLYIAGVALFVLFAAL